MSVLSGLRIVRSAKLREIVLAQVIALVETNPAGVRVDMNSAAQRILPNAPHALAWQLMKLVTIPTSNLSATLRSLELDEQPSRRQREALRTALGVFGSRGQSRVLYQVIREAIDRNQLYIRTTAEEGHIVRVVTYWQDQADRRASEATPTD